MSWLLAHMWMALAAVGLFGLLFGWSIRGILLVGKLRTARVDRDVAKTELEQARAEIEGLYAAQRNVTSGASDPHLKAELNVREKRMTELSAELARSKAELESLKTGAGRGAAAAAPIVAKPPASGEVEEPTLLWRNRHLEGRVRHLEAALHQKSHDGAPGVSPAAASASAAAVTAMAVSGSAADTTEADKLKWQADFLKQRVEALEAELADQPTAAAVTETYPESDANEELARLRWRNRYLEGRVAYFEGDSTSVESVEELVSDEPEEEPGELVSATDAILNELEEADAAADAEEVDVDELEDDESDFDEDEESDDDSEDDDGDMGTEDDVDADEESEDEESLDEDAGEGEYDEDMDEDDSSEDDELSEDEAIDAEDEYDDVDSGEDDYEAEEFEDDESDEDDEDAEDDESDEDELSDDGQVEAERPIALEKPVAGAPDDLTIIGGIGPKIQEVLNELGIFHYDQIAAWSPENISWIDNHLNFSGRIAREGWVEQAAILSGDVADE